MLGSHPFPDHARIAMEPTPPRSVTDYCNGFFVAREPSPKHGPYPDDSGVVCRDRLGADEMGVSVELKARFSRLGGGHTGQRMAAVAKVTIFRIRERRTAFTAEDH